MDVRLRGFGTIEVNGHEYAHDVVIDAGWVTKDVVCAGVAAGSVAACN